jgi:hypothetical protein
MRMLMAEQQLRDLRRVHAAKVEQMRKICGEECELITDPQGVFLCVPKPPKP